MWKLLLYVSARHAALRHPAPQTVAAGEDTEVRLRLARILRQSRAKGRRPTHLGDHAFAFPNGHRLLLTWVPAAHASAGRAAA